MGLRHLHRPRREVRWAASAAVAEVVLLLARAVPAASGQVVVDGTLRPATPLGAGPHFTIPASAGRSGGGNLFHSFNRFDIPAGGSATFTAPPNVRNILSRVTGGAPSHIDGRLATRVEGLPDTPHPADLYLINPAGVVFGPGASLDVGGSFAVTTADYVRLADGTQFNASPNVEPVLRTAAPAAFGFLASAPAPVTVQGAALATAEGKGISIVGGKITIAGGQLRAPAGRVAVAAVGSAGEVKLDVADAVSVPDAGSLSRLGDVDLSDGALVSVDGDAGGLVVMTAGTLRATDVFTTAASRVGHATDAIRLDLIRIRLEARARSKGRRIRS